MAGMVAVRQDATIGVVARIMLATILLARMVERYSWYRRSTMF